MSILKEGDTGPGVEVAQKSLNGFGAKLNVDGSFGPLTTAAVKVFQHSVGLVPDGIIGPLTAAKLLPAPLVGGPLKVLDIYHGDNILSWDTIAKSFAAVFMKSSQGMGKDDGRFLRNWQAAKSRGMLHGAYHFMEWGAGTGKAQARHCKMLIDAAGGVDANTMPPSCDWEFSPERDPRMSDLPTGKDFVEEIAQIYGRKPIIYLSSGTPASYNTPKWMADYYLWVASYRSQPKIPQPWTEWTFWQYSDSAVLPGVGNKGDGDLFNGNMDQLKNL